MNTVLWITLGLTVWSVASLPLGIVVGRAIGRSDSTPRPTPSGTTTHVLAA